MNVTACYSVRLNRLYYFRKFLIYIGHTMKGLALVSYLMTTSTNCLLTCSCYVNILINILIMSFTSYFSYFRYELYFLNDIHVYLFHFLFRGWDTLVEQELLILPEHMSSSPVFSGVHVTRSFVFLYVCFVDRCLSFCTLSFGHCVVCSSSIYRS